MEAGLPTSGENSGFCDEGCGAGLENSGLCDEVCDVELSHTELDDGERNGRSLWWSCSATTVVSTDTVPVALFHTAVETACCKVH